MPTNPVHRRTIIAAALTIAVTVETLGLAFFAPYANAVEPPRGPVHYRLEANVFITMRDGTRLATDLYIPDIEPSGKFPVVLIRTPYGNISGRSNNGGAADVFASHGYVVAVQDKRGKHRSEGVYSVSGGDANDGYDTVDWLSRQPWSNGRVGTYGCSYAGDVQIFLAQTKHPALKAMIPQASSSSVGSAGGLYRYFGARQGGAINWAADVGWFAENGQKISPRLPADLDRDVYTANLRPWDQPPKPTGLDVRRAWYHLPMRDALSDQSMPPSDFEDTITKPPNDQYWLPFPYMTDAYTSDVPALFVNSWYDMGADVTLFEYNWLRTHSLSEKARTNQYFIMSPGSHCSSEDQAGPNMTVGARPMGDTRFDYWQTYLTWFDYWLKEDSAAGRTINGWPKLRYYVMGADAWNSADGWPVTNVKFTNFYLSSRGHANSLSGDGSLSNLPPEGRGISSDGFIYDPANPVPSLGGGMCCSGSADAQPGAFDQRPIESRDDVLVYSSPVLASGVNVTGQVDVVLYVSSSAIDTDFTAKLIDVYPDGRAFNVLEGILRARYREGQNKEIWMRPNTVYPLRISLGATSNYFAAKHRLRLEISSSNFPEFDRNLNIGGNNAEGTHWVIAKNSISHSAKYPSHLVLPIARD
jgi:putative CocE/NonD family hydrolase